MVRGFSLGPEKEECQVNVLAMGDLEKPPHTPNLTFYIHLRNPCVSFVQKQSVVSSFSWYLDRTCTAHVAVVRGFSLGPKTEECHVNVLVMGELEKPSPPPKI